MPASIVHMLIAREVRNRFRTGASLSGLPFPVDDPAYETCMNLGALGPDLPYYESVARGLKNLLLRQSDKPMGVDQWSYQMHSKAPNLFPLKMIEIIWKESSIEKEEWDEEDHRKFAFVCGYLTHMAADQIVHPVVNLIAGPYYKRGDAREKHRECEIFQDVFAYRRMVGDPDFRAGGFNQWCDISPGLGANAQVWLRYLLQKAFVEAHAVMPAEEEIEDWVDGLLTMLRLIDNVGPYVKAYEALARDGREKKRDNIDLVPPKDASEEKRAMCDEIVGNRRYVDFFEDAVELACVYVRAAMRIYDLDELDDDGRRRFTDVVSGADLSAPLAKDILEGARRALEAGGPR